MFIPDPDFYQSRILDPTTAAKEGKNRCLSIFVATNFTELKIIYFEQVEKEV
jgi:hypothetical protein